MLKDSKIYKVFSHAMPYIVGFGAGSGFAFLVTLIPKVKDLHTAWIVLITLGIVLVAMLISYLIFKVIIPKTNTNKLFKKYLKRKVYELAGIIDPSKSAEDIKPELAKLAEEVKNKKIEVEKQKQATKAAGKTQKATDIFNSKVE